MDQWGMEGSIRHVKLKWTVSALCEGENDDWLCWTLWGHSDWLGEE